MTKLDQLFDKFRENAVELLSKEARETYIAETREELSKAPMVWMDDEGLKITVFFDYCEEQIQWQMQGVIGDWVEQECFNERCYPNAAANAERAASWLEQAAKRLRERANQNQ